MMTDVKDSLRLLSDSFRSFQLEYIKSHADVVNKVDVASRRIDEHDRDLADFRAQIKEITQGLEKLEKLVAPLIAVNRVLIFVGGILAAAVITFIGALLTHQIGVVLHP